ncbi:hypothetical protein [Lunatibacter salilacus]|uniref:hypothetical protein n=1 Tax=Lunatibacter salilacus TaxID=2483804 RepID=UPI00131ABE37|nr:hypothetical protein [Lunatibacter salilacus]
MKNPIKIALWIALILIMVGFGYVQLGGFSPIDISLVECTDLKLVGVEYKGTPQDEMLASSFRNVEDTKLANPGSILHTIYYIEPAGKSDTMHVFVGIQRAAVRGSVSAMTEKKVSCRRAVVAKISAHRFVMPSPLRIKEKMKEFASNEGLVLQDIFVDKLLDDSNVEVWAPVIES